MFFCVMGDTGGGGGWIFPRKWVCQEDQFIVKKLEKKQYNV